MWHRNSCLCTLQEALFLSHLLSHLTPKKGFSEKAQTGMSVPPYAPHFLGKHELLHSIAPLSNGKTGWDLSV